MRRLCIILFAVSVFATAKSQKVVVESALPEPCSNITLAVENPKNLNQLMIYPNPSDGRFTIEGFISSKTENASILLHDTSGKLIFKKQVKTADRKIKEELNADKLNAGVYILTIQTNTEKINRKIIIKK